MSAEGGIKIVSLKSFKENWFDIKQKVEKQLVGDITQCKRWIEEKPEHFKKEAERELPSIEQTLEEVSKLPNSIESEEDFDSVMQYLSQYETPYLYKEDLIFAWGDNVRNEINIFTDAMNGVTIQTWS